MPSLPGGATEMRVACGRSLGLGDVAAYSSASAMNTGSNLQSMMWSVGESEFSL